MLLSGEHLYQGLAGIGQYIEPLRLIIPACQVTLEIREPYAPRPFAAKLDELVELQGHSRSIEALEMRVGEVLRADVQRWVGEKTRLQCCGFPRAGLLGESGELRISGQSKRKRLRQGERPGRLGGGN